MIEQPLFIVTILQILCVIEIFAVARSKKSYRPYSLLLLISCMILLFLFEITFILNIDLPDIPSIGVSK